MALHPPLLIPHCGAVRQTACSLTWESWTLPVLAAALHLSTICAGVSSPALHACR